ncbi:hypothetical protein BGW41_006635 [Actinomortierella wolfii]|nr:hypothetical protein BGW41_006635 [Actinomortierella wolfii]
MDIVLGSEQDAAPDADEVDEGSVMLEDVTLHSPFCDLIKELYRLYGHDPTKMTLHAKPISSQLLDELVVLSGIINTIDNVNAPFYAQFAELKKSCIVKDFMTPTKHQVDFVDSMLSETKFLQTMDLNALDIWSLRKSCDLRESMARRSPFYVTPSIESAEEDLTICLLIHTLCKEILLTKNRPCSEQEDVCLWRDVARVLHHGDVIPRIGELSSAAVRSDRRLVEGAISRDRASTQARGRKIDLFFQLKAEKKQPVELFCWEAKTSDAGSTQLQTQRSGRTALPYRIRKLEDGIFVAGAVLEDQDLIYLPRAKEDMVEFLREGGLTALLNTKRLNDEYSRTVNDGIRAVKREEAKNRMLGLESSRGCRNPMINTPIKKQKMTTPRTPSPRKNN